MVLYLYAPEEGIDRVYYNPAGSLPDGKFSVWSYIGSDDKLKGIGSFRDDQFMKNTVPPFVNGPENIRRHASGKYPL